MKTKEQILEEYKSLNAYDQEIMVLEVLIDIRDLLKNERQS